MARTRPAHPNSTHLQPQAHTPTLFPAHTAAAPGSSQAVNRPLLPQDVPRPLSPCHRASPGRGCTQPPLSDTVPLQCGLLGSLQLGLVIRRPYRWPLGSYRMDKSQAVAHTAAYKVIRTNKKQVQGLNACIPWSWRSGTSWKRRTLKVASKKTSQEGESFEEILEETVISTKRKRKNWEIICRSTISSQKIYNSVA